MAAGLGFKDFTTGEVLTAADVDGYLMQGIWVFASAAARDAAVTSPQEGNACYLKDTNQVLTYSGSAWVAVGGGSPLTTKGDVYGFSTTDARIPIGANNTVLTADSTQALGLKWAAATSSFVGCSIYKTSAQTIANDTGVVVTFDSEYVDTDSFHSTSTNTGRITIPSGKDGKYLITGLVNWDANATGTRMSRVRINGTTVLSQVEVNNNGASRGIGFAHSFIYSLVATDYLEIIAYQTSGGNLDVLGSSNNPTLFSVVYLGA